MPPRAEATSLVAAPPPPPLLVDGLARAFLPLRRLGGGRWLSGSAVAVVVPRRARTRTLLPLPPGEAGPPPALGEGGVAPATARGAWSRG